MKIEYDKEADSLYMQFREVHVDNNIDVVKGLIPELIQEVIDFIEFLKIKRMKKTGINHSSLLLQQESLSRIWGSESEDLYEL